MSLDLKIRNQIIKALYEAYYKYNWIMNLIDGKYIGEYELEYRIKSPKKIKAKYEHNPDKWTNDVNKIPDILAFRISVPTEDDCRRIIEAFKEHFSLSYSHDYFQNPKPTGFKAYVFHFSDKEINLKFEVQVMTYEMRDWTNQSHDEYDIDTYGRVLDTAELDELRSIYLEYIKFTIEKDTEEDMNKFIKSLPKMPRIRKRDLIKQKWQQRLESDQVEYENFVRIIASLSEDIIKKRFQEKSGKRINRPFFVEDETVKNKHKKP